MSLLCRYVKRAGKAPASRIVRASCCRKRTHAVILPDVILDEYESDLFPRITPLENDPLVSDETAIARLWLSRVEDVTGHGGRLQRRRAGAGRKADGWRG